MNFEMFVTWLDFFADLTTLVSVFFIAPLAYLKRDRIRRWLGVFNRYQGNGEELQDIQADGVVFTVSHKETPIWLMDKVRPTHIALVYTQLSRPFMEEIREYANQQHINVVSTKLLKDPDELRDAREAVSSAIHDLRHHGCQQPAVDLTGGNSIMSLGAFQAGGEAGVNVIYISPPYDEQLRRRDLSRAKILAIVEAPGSQSPQQ